uniref:Vitellogenin domain-containing protein n=1 Tax=Odontomachus monticola TaxID=613454 RepID=A0A348G695_ODOMO
MLCRTEKYKKMILQSSSNFSSMIEEDFEHSSSKLTDRRIRHDSFDQPGTPFEVQFDHSGVISYIVEKKDTESMKMNNVYRMIANLMSVGAYGINYESDSFSVMELSTVGYCSTNYTIARYSSSKKKILSKKLSPYFAQHFNESETMLISKHRDIDTCTELSHYSFAARFWHQFVPALSITEDIRKSESFITLNDDTLKSVTENSFDFLDEEGDRIGSVVETATLKLTSVDMKSIYGQFNSNTNYILDIVNDDEI